MLGTWPNSTALWIAFQPSHRRAGRRPRVGDDSIFSPSPGVGLLPEARNSPPPRLPHNVDLTRLPRTPTVANKHDSANLSQAGRLSTLKWAPVKAR